MNKREMREVAIKRLNKMYETGPYTTQDIVVALAGSSGWVGRIIDLLTDDDDMEGYAKLPVDANGEVIHIGDELQWDDGERLTVIGVCNDIVFYVNDDSLGGAQWTKANNKRHYHKPTVEDVLRELVIACEDAGNAGPAVEALISKHAEKLMFKED